jgi:hypothetical protein
MVGISNLSKEDILRISQLTDEIGLTLDNKSLRHLIPALMSMIAGYINEWSAKEKEALEHLPDPDGGKDRALLFSRYEKLFDVIDFLLFTVTKENRTDAKWILDALTEKFTSTKDGGYMTNDGGYMTNDNDPFNLNDKLDDFNLN